MTTAPRPHTFLTLILGALALTACGGVGTPGPAAPTEVQASGAVQLVTLRVGASVGAQALRAAVQGAEVLLLDHATGRAVLSVPDRGGTLRAAGLRGLNLGALDAGVLAVEANGTVRLPDDVAAQGLTTWAGGLTTWAGGLTTWAGGLTTWAGGAGFLDAGTLAGVQAYWDRLGIAKAHSLMPELGAGVKVAVIDTGVDFDHPMLSTSLDGANDWDFVDRDPTAAEGRDALNTSGYGHGTAVAGIILQLAPRATIVPYRVLKPDGSGDLDNVIRAVNKATTDGAQVINLSLGSASDSWALNEAVRSALAKGLVVVNSAGNGGTEGLVYPSNNLNTLFPATSGLLGVGSVDAALQRSAFSQYGSNLSLTAPGEGVLTTFPGANLVKATGTSFAAPAVAGAAALALSAGVTPVGTLAAGLRASATANRDPALNAKLGAGTLNAGAFADRYR